MFHTDTETIPWEATKALFDTLAVLGAGGNMGKGISCCLSQLILSNPVYLSTQTQLILIDTDTSKLAAAKQYIVEILSKTHSPTAVAAFNQRVHLSSKLTDLASAQLIFEAVYELLDLKTDLLKRCREHCSEHTLFFTNTSSIPIFELEKRTQLTQRLIGFHFYNPPAIQKLIEIIPSKNTPSSLIKLSYKLSSDMSKTAVFSADAAGFIGNGHFIREAMFAIQKTRALMAYWSPEESIFLINRVTKDFLLRPMGIWNVIDYVGLHVFKDIARIMDQFISDESFSLEQLSSFSDTSLTAALPMKTEKKLNKWLGKPPYTTMNWKQLKHDPSKAQVIAQFFSDLQKSRTRGSALARSFLKESQSISKQLVKKNIAASTYDVDTVLKMGFHHLYGASINPSHPHRSSHTKKA